MPNVNIHFETSGNEEKFPFGPITAPRPGPTFEIEVAAPDIEVMKSKPVKDNKAVIKKNMTKYMYINEMIDEINLSSIGFLLYFNTKIPFG